MTWFEVGHVRMRKSTLSSRFNIISYDLRIVVPCVKCDYIQRSLPFG